jgi:hypothetical protein
MQVLQDLESQIADMLVQQPQPLTEEAVVALIRTLEPPSHFAATYGNGKQSTPPPADWKVRLPPARWPLVSVVSCALLPVGFLLFWMAAATRTGEVAEFALFLMLVGLAFTPFALWMASKQLRAQPEQAVQRDLLLKSTIVYGVCAPALLMALLTAVTEGLVLFPFGILAFVYFQYLLIRRVYRYMAAVAPQAASASAGNTSEHATGSPITAACP